MTDKVKLESLLNIILLEFALSWDLVSPTFTGYLSAFTTPSTPLEYKPHQDNFSLTLIPKTVRYDHSNGRTIRTLRI